MELNLGKKYGIHIASILRGREGLIFPVARCVFSYGQDTGNRNGRTIECI